VHTYGSHTSLNIKQNKISKYKYAAKHENAIKMEKKKTK